MVLDGLPKHPRLAQVAACLLQDEPKGFLSLTVECFENESRACGPHTSVGRRFGGKYNRQGILFG